MSNAPNKEDSKKEPSNTMIYVSNLPFTTKDEQLRELFKDFDVKTAYVATRRNGRSKGFGFVNLTKESDQTKAIEKVDGKEFEGRKLTAKIAFNDDRRNEKGELKEQFKKQLPTKQEGPPSETVVYVSNLPWSYKDEDLKKFFGELAVKNASVAVRRNGRSKGFGFVEFATKEDQQKGLALDQKKIDDRTVTVKAAVNYRGAEKQPKPSLTTGGSQGGRRTGGGGRFNNNNNNNNDNRGGRRGPSQGGRRTGGGNRTGGNNRSNDNKQPVTVRQPARTENTLYVSNLPFDLDDNDLKQIFSEFNVKAANVAVRQNGRSLGFGFVEFTNANDQKNALEALDQSEVNNRVITVKVATGRRTGGDNRSQGGNNRNQGGNRTGGRTGGAGGRRNNSNNNNQRRRRPSNTANEKREPSATMIYVSNLPFSVDDKGLQQIFTGYKVSKAYVAVRRNGRSKGFGFVDFASAEDQQKALKLNGQEVDGRPLTIQIANKVEAKQEATNTNTTTTPTTTTN